MAAFRVLLVAALFRVAAIAMAPLGSGVRPVVGIYPTLAKWLKPDEQESYYRGYSEWVEQFGALPVVLPNEGDADWYLQRLNALLIPGGPTTPVAAFADRLIRRAIKANMDGDYFPVWGTCLGYEWLMESVGGLSAMEVGEFQAMDLPDTLTFTQVSPGRMFGAANSTLMNWFATKHITYEDHQDGIEPARFGGNLQLSSMFDVVATSTDRKGQRYVAAVEGKQLPIYGIQFHPEKIRYVNNTWNTHVPKSGQANDGADLLAAFLVAEARKSGHRPTDSEVFLAARAESCRGEGADLCSCEELEAEGYVDAETCRAQSPLPAMDFCRTRGPCRRRGTSSVLFM